MIEVTRLDDSKMVVNVQLIQSLQATPDTVITFTTRERMMVKESVEEVSKRILRYQRSIHSDMPLPGREPGPAVPDIDMQGGYRAGGPVNLREPEAW